MSELIDRWLFETPIWVIATMGVAGIWLAVLGNARTSRTLMLGGGFVLLTGLLLLGVSRLVVTDRERVERDSRRLTTLLVEQDWQSVEPLLSPRVQARAGAINLPGRDAVLAAAQSASSLARFSSITVLGLETRRIDPDRLDVFMLVFSQHDRGPPARTNWRLEWTRDEGDWSIRVIESIPGGDEFASPERIGGRLRG